MKTPALFLFLALPALAQTFTWDGGSIGPGDDNFTTDANWSPDGAPGVGLGVILHFTGSIRPTPENNFTTGADFGEWRLVSGSGTGFTIGGAGFGLHGKIEVNAGVGQDLAINTAGIFARDAGFEINPVGGNITLGSSTPVELNDNATLNVYDGNNSRTLTINGTLSNGNGTGGNGSLILNETSTVVLAGTSNDYGNTTINSGTTLRVGDGSANGSLGSGTVGNSGTLIFNRGSGSSYDQGATVTGTGTFRVQSGTVVGTMAASFGGSGAKVDIQSGGAINLNGVDRSGSLFDVTLAGTGNGGSGAIFNSGGFLGSNSGIRNVTLAANTTVNVAGSGVGNRFDFRSDGTLNLTGFNLTKEGGGNLVITSTPGSTGTMIVSVGTLAFEANFTGAGTSGYNISVASGAAVGGYNGRTINSTVTLNGTTAAIYSHGGAASTWAGNVVLNGGGLVDLSNRVYALDTGVVINLTGVVSGNGGLTVSGATALRSAVLTNTGNNFTGGVTVSGDNSVLRVSSDTALGPTSNTVTLQSGGRLMNGNTGAGVSFSLDAARTINLASGIGRFHIWGGQTLTVPGTISGPGNLVKTDSGLLVLSGANSYGGYTQIVDASQIRLDANNVIPDTSSVLIYGNSTFNVNGRTETVAGLHVGSASDTNATVQLGSGANLTVTGTAMPGGSPTNIGGDFYARITGTGNITYNHSSNSQANWYWRNTANDFTGNVIITSGRLNVLDASLGNAGNDIVLNGDVVATLGNGQGKASLQQATAANITLNSGRTITLNTGKEGTLYAWGSFTMQVDGQITGGGNLRKEDGGILLLNNTGNNYGGVTKVILGEIRAGAAGVLPDTTELVMAGGTVNLNGFSETVESVSGTSGTVTGTAASTLTLLTSGAKSYSGSITGGIALNMNGAGAQTLAGTISGVATVNVNSGILRFGAGDRWGDHTSTSSAVITVNAGATLESGGFFNTITNPVLAGGTVVLNGGGSANYPAFAFKGTVTVNGSSASNINVGAGVNNAISIGATEVNGATTFAVADVTNSTAADLTINAPLKNNRMNDDSAERPSGLTKTGLGTLVLTGNNVYTGNTEIQQGTLVINGTHTGGGLITALSGATLGGTGTMVNVEIADAGGILAPGSSAGTIRIGNLALNATSILEIELGDPTIPSASDRVVVTDFLNDFGGLLNVSALPSLGAPGLGASWLVFDYSAASGSINSGSTLALGTNTTGLPLALDNRPEAKQVWLTVVPEPASAGLLLLGVLFLRALRTRRQ